MRPTQGVSFPRSGHKAVYDIAKRYFGDAFVYCDANNKKHCGCGQVPCVNPNRTFAKNHDFGLKISPGVRIIPSERYFIQYRNPVRSIVSNYHLYLKNNPHACERADWEKFAFRNIFFWNRFIDKWVLDFPADAAPPLYCTYESLIADPEARVKEIHAYMSEEPVDNETLSLILEENPIIPRYNLERFRFHDPVFFEELEDAASERLAELDLPSFAVGA